MRISLAVVLFVMLAGCSDSSSAVQGPKVDGSGGTGDVGLSSDASDTALGATDALTADSPTATDAQADTQPDVLVQDSLAAPDSAVDVASATDASVQDSAAPADSASQDVAAKDAASGCALKEGEFDATRKKALACATPFQCWHPGPKQMSCPCQQYYSDATIDWQSLNDVQGEATKLGCVGTCSKDACPALDTQIGVCTDKQCQTVTPNCKQIEQLGADAIAEGKKCSADSECTFQAIGSVACGCTTFLNVKSMGPGKPLFKYFVMLVNSYKVLKCTDTVECACQTFKTAHCVAGVCKGDVQ